MEILERPAGVTLAQIGPPPDQASYREVGLSANQLRGSSERIVVATHVDVQIGKTQGKQRLVRTGLRCRLKHGDALTRLTEPLVQGSEEED